MDIPRNPPRRIGSSSMMSISELSLDSEAFFCRVASNDTIPNGGGEDCDRHTGARGGTDGVWLKLAGCGGEGVAGT